MPRYHITSRKEIKPCKETNCRAKYGPFENKTEANKALKELTKKTSKSNTVKAKKEDEPIVDEISTIEIDTIIADSNISDKIESIEEKIHKLQESEEASNEEYFDDDLQFLKGDDKAIAIEKDQAIFEQNENLISWKLDNFFDEDGKRRSKYSLRSNPPILRIESSEGDGVEFVLTKELSITLAETFETVKRGYYGVDPKRKNSLTQKEAKSKVESAKEWVSEHPVKSVILAVMFVLFVITAFIM